MLTFKNLKKKKKKKKKKKEKEKATPPQHIQPP